MFLSESDKEGKNEHKYVYSNVFKSVYVIKMLSLHECYK
jgi:hypothetical protein